MLHPDRGVDEGVAVGRSKRVLIFVQDLPAPFDRRVWMGCRASVAAGFGVSVICLKGPGDPWHHVVEDMRIYKYPGPRRARRAAGFAFELVYCWLWTALLSVVVAVRDGAVQVCNPPDTYFLLGRLWALLGKKFVFDQHDLNPELYLSRFGEPRGRVGRLQLRLPYAIEVGTYRAAGRVISTNVSCRSAAAVSTRRPPPWFAAAPTPRSCAPLCCLSQPSLTDVRTCRATVAPWAKEGVVVAIRALVHIVPRARPHRLPLRTSGLRRLPGRAGDACRRPRPAPAPHLRWPGGGATTSLPICHRLTWASGPPGATF